MIKRLISLLLLLAFLMIAFQFLISSILIVKPEQTISQWENKNLPIDIEQAESIISRLSRAEKLSLLPFKLTDKNKINELYSRLYLVLAEVEQSTANLQLAEYYALKMTHSAPSHYLGWTLLAQSRITRLDYTWEDQSALSKSLRLGPFERKNQIRLIPIIVEHWERLTSKNKLLANNMLRASLNELHMSRSVALNMRQFKNTIPFKQLIANSKFKQRIMRVLEQ
ncbi:hypothetical protein AB6T38_09705 [Aliiglaciecola sp. SL4]|uniref:hypothetical protein n=1 Tax=Aliiglaciecola sp. SL4 TaxID=3239806 RepID=UPI00355BC5FC